MGKVVGWGWGAGGTFDLHGDGYSVVVVVMGEKGVVMVSPFIFMVMVIQWWWSWGKKGWLWCHPSSSWWWLFSGGGHGEKRGGYGVTLHLHGDGYSVVVVMGKKGVVMVSPFIFMVMVIQWWWSWGKKGWLWCHPSSSWWWLFSGGGRGGKRGGYGVTLHLHGDGYSVVVVVREKVGVGGCHPSSSWRWLFIGAGLWLQVATGHGQCLTSAARWTAASRALLWTGRGGGPTGGAQVWWTSLQVRSLRSSGVVNGSLGEMFKKFRCDEWVCR